MRSPHPGRLDGVSLVAAPELLSEPLAPSQVRVSVRAAGMNFRDVLERAWNDLRRSLRQRAELPERLRHSAKV